MRRKALEIRFGDLEERTVELFIVITKIQELKTHITVGIGDKSTGYRHFIQLVGKQKHICHFGALTFCKKKRLPSCVKNLHTQIKRYRVLDIYKKKATLSGSQFQVNFTFTA